MTQAANSLGEPFRIIPVEQVIREIGTMHTELHPHCTDTPNIRDHWRRTPDGIHWQKVMRGVHMRAPRNWNDIAQHYTLLPNGLFVTGRGLRTTPASIVGFNGRAPDRVPLCVEMLGNFNPGIDELVGEQRRAILILTKHFLDQGKFIRFHNEHSNKSCPGRLIVKSEFLAEARAIGKATAPASAPPVAPPRVLHRVIIDGVQRHALVSQEAAEEMVAKYVLRKGATVGIVQRTDGQEVFRFPRQGSVTAVPSLRIRRGHGTSHAVIGSYKTGDRIDILETREGWHRTRDGWVSAQFVKLL